MSLEDVKAGKPLKLFNGRHILALMRCGLLKNVSGSEAGKEKSEFDWSDHEAIDALYRERGATGVRLQVDATVRKVLAAVHRDNAQVARLREALRPFARLAGNVKGMSDDYIVAQIGLGRITAGDIRAAARKELVGLDSKLESSQATLLEALEDARGSISHIRKIVSPHLVGADECARLNLAIERCDAAIKSAKGE